MSEIIIKVIAGVFFGGVIVGWAMLMWWLMLRVAKDLAGASHQEDTDAT